MSGKILYINGVTSTGKTSVSREIQRTAKNRFYYLSDDLFGEMSHRRFFGENGFWQELYRSNRLMYKTARMLALEGENVIIDGVLVKSDDMPDLYEKLLEETDGIGFFMAQLTCPSEECRRRNLERGNRGEHQSAWQAEHMTPDIVYDVSVDSYVNSVERCAELILSVICE